MPMHMGNSFSLGETAGEVSHTLIFSEMPQHTHQAQGVSALASSTSPNGATWADSPADPYSASSNATMNAASVTSLGGGGAHYNMPPYLVLNFAIALEGIFPSQN
jgi:microcystin-dependent protein